MSEQNANPQEEQQHAPKPPPYLVPLLIGCTICFVLGVVVGMVASPLKAAAPSRPSEPDSANPIAESSPEFAEPEPASPAEPIAAADTGPQQMVCFRGNPERNLSGVGTVPRNPKLLWRFRTKTKHEGPYEQRGDPSLLSSTPWHGLGWTGQPCIVDGNVLFGSTDSYVYRLDLATGKELWHYGLHHSIKGSISVLGDGVYHGGRDNKVRRYDMDGQLVWETRIGQDTDSNPVIVDGRLYIGGEDNTVYCFDPETGEVIWTYGPTAGSCESSPCVAEDTVVIGSSAGQLYCLNAKTGDLIWQYATGGDGDPTPAYFDGRVYHAVETGGGIERGRVHCIDLGTGDVVWTKDMPRGIWASVAINQETRRVYVGCNNGALYCLASDTGDTLWERQLTGARIWSSPVVVDGVILVGVRDGTLWCLDERFGEPIWVFDEGYDIDATPAVAEGRIVIGSQNGWIYCIGEAAENERLSPSWFRQGPDFSVRTDPARLRGPPTTLSSAPEPSAHQDTHAACRDGYLEPRYGPGHTRASTPTAAGERVTG